MSYHDLKATIYIMLPGFGCLLVALGLYNSAKSDAISLLTSLLMIAGGAGLILFGLVTFLLKDDPDVWR
jgi:hypothetical protein